MNVTVCLNNYTSLILAHPTSLLWFARYSCLHHNRMQTGQVLVLRNNIVSGVKFRNYNNSLLKASFVYIKNVKIWHPDSWPWQLRSTHWARLEPFSVNYLIIKVDVTNRTNNVDLENYVKNGEWELLETRLIRANQFFPCCPEPYPYVMVTVKYDSLHCAVQGGNLGCLLQDKKEDPLLHVQHCVPLHDDVHTHGASLLHASRLRGEDCLRCDCYPGVLRLHVGHSGEDARDQWINPSDRYFFLKSVKPEK